MKRIIFLLVVAGLSVPVADSQGQEKSGAPLFKSNDRVVFVGNTIIERARHFGQIESALQLAAGPDVTGLTFRNLGWSGDSVFGDARSYFGEPSEGRERLAKGLGELKPNVVLICYGTGAAMSVDQGWTYEKTAEADSAAGLEKSLATFRDGYEKLLKLVSESAGKNLREVVLIAPPPLENLGKPLPDQTNNNKNLARFRDAIRELADGKKHRFVDLFAAMGGDDFIGKIADPPLTDNGIHFGDAGYRVVARHLADGLGFASDRIGKNDEAVSQLRKQIVAKNTLFFNQWRPANETYLFLFRKHEQGQNAKEIPMFDPLIEAEEKKIEELRARILKGDVKR